MFINVTSTAPPSISDLGTFTEFHIVAEPALSTAAIDAALQRSALGHLDGDHAYIIPASLAELASAHPGYDESWPEHFDAMVAYALSKGWTDQTGALVRAHIVQN